MSITTVGFFNNKGGVGKTTLVYHLAWMYADTGKRIVAADLDPQANLTSSFLEEDRLEEIWAGGSSFQTIYRSVEPIMTGKGDINVPTLEIFDSELALVVGDLSLSEYEDQLSEAWPKCLGGEERAFRVTSAFWRIVQAAGERHDAELILLDLGPNLGAINRAALLATDYVVVPLEADLFSLQGLHNLGPRLRKWRSRWKRCLEECRAPDLSLPLGQMHPLGYIVMQHSIRLDRPVRSYERWIERIPSAFHQDVLGEEEDAGYSVNDDPQCLALLKHYRSLMAMAHENRKPMFHLRSADGAIGSHLSAARHAGGDFKDLAERIEKEIHAHEQPRSGVRAATKGRKR
ncbi:MAG: ParA family protein [Candidatus Hydrogenedentota bacterium]